MFTVCSVPEIESNLILIDSHSSYQMSEEAKMCAKELQIFKIIFLQCIFNMKEIPYSIGVQILPRSLVFYSELKYFTKLIDEFDRNSSLTCSLSVPYQYLQPPGNEYLFSYENHRKPITCVAMGGDNDQFVFILSNKLTVFSMDDLSELCHVKFKKDESPFSILIVYTFGDIEKKFLEVKNQDKESGFIVLNKKQYMSYKFSGILVATKSFEFETISNAYLLSRKHILISFENRRYFDVYDFTTSTFIKRQNFDSIVKFVKVNTHHKYVNNCDYFENSEICIYVVLEYSHIFIFNVKLGQNDEILDLDLMHEYQATGFECYSIKIKFKFYYHFKIEDCLITQSDGCLINIKPDYCEFYKPLLINTQLKIIDFNKENYLLLGSNRKLYASICSFPEQHELIEIDGTFDNGKYFSSNTVLGFSNGIISVHAFKIEKEKKRYTICKINEIDAHFDKITYSFAKGLFENKIIFIEI